MNYKSNTLEPADMLWYDTSTKLLMFYDGETWNAVNDVSDIIKNISKLNDQVNTLNSAFINNDPTQSILRAVYIGSTAPANIVANTLWYDTSANILRLYDGNAWQSINDFSSILNSISNLNAEVNAIDSAFLDNDPTKPVLRATYIGSSAPSNPVAGTTWLDTSQSTPTLKVYDGNNWQTASGGSGGSSGGDASTLNGYKASQTPTANTIPVSLNSGKLDDGWLNFVANDPKVKTSLNASGNAPIYACRAWVNFDGTTSSPTIKASGNVSSVGKTGTGKYLINFATALPDTNYVSVFGGRNIKGDGNGGWLSEYDDGSSQGAKTTTSVLCLNINGNGNFYDVSTYMVSIFR